MWKDHVLNPLGNSFKVKTIIKIINSQLDITLGQITLEELKVVLTRVKQQNNSRSKKYGRQRYLMTFSI